MDEYFLQELNAITSYANNSNTDSTMEHVKIMLTKLLNSNHFELSGNRVCELDKDEVCKGGNIKSVKIKDFKKSFKTFR